MEIKNLDHLVLTVADIDKTIAFYTDVMGFEAVVFGENRKALIFGNQKINLHQKGYEFEPKAETPTCGSADLCFIAQTDIHEVMEELKLKNIKIIEGIVDRTGATGKIKSVYFRDPDQNLIEVSNHH
ncbi:VOC family protein (plasmid) [Chryseobacterium panacisoli]|uniref:VOC family protein n=1 Tax=Chryseobacterium panacisoli TaxID=1807141 RepID=A0A5D8ZWH0_9FLAO|nr:VOC family protein [Chryseobacterium panacisoli]TZF98860.1 VOC family protein [Chryseobacterium panacisoli]